MRQLQQWHGAIELAAVKFYRPAQRCQNRIVGMIRLNLSHQQRGFIQPPPARRSCDPRQQFGRGGFGHRRDQYFLRL